jgi:hypothetical protein
LEYVLFETPTFFLFVVVLVLIAAWKEMVVKRKQGEAPSGIREIAFAIILGLLYIAIIVALVILVETDDDESECKGRVADDNSSLEDSLRILSISYMTVVTCLAIVLVGALLYEARTMLNMMANGFFSVIFYIPASRFALVFLLFFLLRCALFLALYAQGDSFPNSDIYIFVLLMVCEVIPCFFLSVEILRVVPNSKKGAYSSSQTPISASQVTVDKEEGGERSRGQTRLSRACRNLGRHQASMM